MLFINGQWEQVNDLEDSLKIIEENLGREFTEKFVDILLHTVDYGNCMSGKTINELYNYMSFEKFKQNTEKKGK